MAAALLYHFWFSKDPMVWFQHGKRYDAIVRICFARSAPGERES